MAAEFGEKSRRENNTQIYLQFPDKTVWLPLKRIDQSVPANQRAWLDVSGTAIVNLTMNFTTTNQCSTWPKCFQLLAKTYSYVSSAGVSLMADYFCTDCSTAKADYMMCMAGKITALHFRFRHALLRLPNTQRHENHPWSADEFDRDNPRRAGMRLRVSATAALQRLQLQPHRVQMRTITVQLPAKCEHARWNSRLLDDSHQWVDHGGQGRLRQIC